ncbi:hypothetical protein TYRP_015628 [Tyrophagus putrescentiae]|nr:hypothetical protein TYRP_015628 [Tyrophagus putrescentiae]
MYVAVKPKPKPPPGAKDLKKLSKSLQDCRDCFTVHGDREPVTVDLQADNASMSFDEQMKRFQ